jgi:hypothetical protein
MRPVRGMPFLQGTAATYAQASRAVNEASRHAAGMRLSRHAKVAKAASNQQSAENLGITQAGYQQGYNQFNAATAALGGAANM